MEKLSTIVKREKVYKTKSLDERQWIYYSEKRSKHFKLKLMENQNSVFNQSRQEAPSMHEVKTLLKWTAPGRPFKKRGRQYYLSGLLIMLPIQVILFLFSQYMLMLVVLSLFFLAIALAVTPPHDFTYKISTEGLTVEDRFFLWSELYDFYFKKQTGVETLFVRTRALFPGALILTLGDMDKEKIKAAMLPYLPFREYVKPTFMEKAGDWLTRTFPLEKLTETRNTLT